MTASSTQTQNPPNQQMPTQVHHPYPHHHSMQREHSREHERDVHGLRLALGSILSPKRLSSPSSRPSSGTASPSPAHFGPGLAHHYHPGPSHLHTPMETHGESEVLAHANGTTPAPQLSHDHDHEHQAHHEAAPPPILTTSNVHNLSEKQAQSVKDAQTSGNAKNNEQNSHSDSMVLMHTREKHDVARPGPGTGAHNNLSDSPRGLSGYIATLQSARAWDALVHGNMS